MGINAPKIDGRSYNDIVTRLEELAAAYTSSLDNVWQPDLNGELDAAQALMRIFGRFSEIIIHRLNQVPDKNFLAFLDLIGTQIQPPQPAVVPVTFALAKGSPAYVRVPAQTRLAAPATDSQPVETVFETMRELIATTANLQAVMVRNPHTDKYANYSQIAATGEGDSFPAFAGQRPIEHALYLALDDYFTLPHIQKASIFFASPHQAQWDHLPLRWSYWNGKAWAELTVSNNTDLTLPTTPAPTIVNGISVAWLRAELAIPLPRGQETAENEQLIRDGLPPDAIVVDSALIELGTAFYPFGEAESSRHFYLNFEESFVRGGADLMLTLLLRQVGLAAASPAQLWWSYWNGEGWVVLGTSTVDNPSLGDSDNFSDGTQALTQDGVVSFKVPFDWEPHTLAGKNGRWLQIHLNQGSYIDGNSQQLPEIDQITAAYRWPLPQLDQVQAQVTVAETGLAPDLGFTNRIPVDFNQDVLPFGEQPQKGAAFYVASQVAFSKPDANITLHFQLAEISPNIIETSRTLSLVWEIYTEEGWKQVGVSTPRETDPNNKTDTFIDGTYALTQSGEIFIHLPSQIKPTGIYGEQNHWLRVRIATGSYGTPGRYVPQVITVGQDKVTFHTLIPPNFILPIIHKLQISYTYAPARRVLDHCLSRNDFTFRNHTKDVLGPTKSFLPFVPTRDQNPALYLGFDKPFANRPTSLYAQVKLPLYSETTAASAQLSNPQLVWEYRAAAGWQRLGSRDETDALQERGLISFIGPHDFAYHAEFDQVLYWLRARWVSGTYLLPPELHTVLTNTTWATQTTTIRHELLGSSSGESGQQFQTSQSPVLLQPQLEVREPELPSAEDQTALETLEGDEAIRTVTNAAGQTTEVWLRWHQVPDFYGSGPRDRHYVLDHLTGRVAFGNGRQGLVPPPGRNNIRLAFYQTGGGEQGNRAAGSVTLLKSAVPYVDGVFNHEAASGGAEQETMAHVKERGPRQLRHRQRAVTAQDFIDLALEASADVARAKAIMPHYDPLTHTWEAPYTAADAGRVGVIIVPDSEEKRPIPSLALVNHVENYLLARCAPTLDLWLAGPNWTEICIKADVVATSFDVADTLPEAIVAALDRFLHPLTGSRSRDGWAFGYRPQLSDIYALLESVAGVDHVAHLEIEETPAVAETPAETADRFLVYSGQHTIRLLADLDT